MGLQQPSKVSSKRQLSLAADNPHGVRFLGLSPEQTTLCYLAAATSLCEVKCLTGQEMEVNTLHHLLVKRWFMLHLLPLGKKTL